MWTALFFSPQPAWRLSCRFGRLPSGFAKKQSKASISEGFVNASLLFCVGAMAIMGALDSGLTGDHSTLYAKATIDGVTSIVYGSTMGVGVARAIAENAVQKQPVP